MSMWIAGATMIVGAGSAIYGADKQRKLTNQTNDANRLAATSADQTNFDRWLMTRGIGEGGAPVNTKLPLWATVTRGAPRADGTAGRWRVAPSLPSGVPGVRRPGGGGKRSWQALGFA
jgi:hypothetical protein